MIKFFRKIRKKMLIENKFSKYLLYAIGEIVLVVIGILIALQINTANTYKEQRKVEQEYLLSLKPEFESNLNRINASIQENEQRIKALDKLLSLFDNNVLDTVSHQEISQMFLPVLGSELGYLPATGVLSDIISSGKLNIILNKNLRQHLASFESTLDLLRLQTNGAKVTDEKLRSLLYTMGSMRSLAVDLGIIDFEFRSISEKVNNKLIFNSIEVENYLLDYLLVARAANGPRIFGGTKAEIETILKEIEQELEK
jgi:hypothetical protein